MSPTDRRRLLLIGAAALFLRAAVAVVTERAPLFPDYYYTDARLMDGFAADSSRELASGRPFSYAGSLSQRFQVRVQTAVYGIVGIRPFAMKALNCALGALGVVAVGATAALALGAASGLGTAALCAAWPSNVFYGSQNFKEAPTNLLASLALLALAALLGSGPRRRTRAAALGAAAAAALLLTGFYRSYVMVVAAAAGAAAVGWSAFSSRRWTAGLTAALVATLTAPAVFRPASTGLVSLWMSAPRGGDPRLQPQLLPVTYDAPTENTYRPTSPRGLSEFRRIRQESDMGWAQRHMQRDISSQIFPDARFRTWADVALFVPKGAFYALFMPLPGLYPMDGKVGRMLAAAENLLLLALALLGAAGALHGPKTPARVLLLLFFALMTGGSALLEFDLGSAGRHKLLFLPMLFPFAVEEALRLLGRKESV